METSTWIALGALLLSFIGLMMNSRKDSRTDAATNAIIQTKLDSLINGVNEIRVEMRSMQETVRDHGERLATVEAHATNMEHRLRSIEGKMI